MIEILGKRIQWTSLQRYAIFVALSVAPLYVSLKVIQAAAQGNAQPVVMGLIRRLDDVTFWAAVAFALSGVGIVRAARLMDIEIKGGLLIAWIVSVVATTSVYLARAASPSDPGTFFNRETGVIWYIQRAEGMLDLSFVAIGSFYLIVSAATLLHSKMLCKEVRQLVVVRILTSLAMIYALALFPYVFQRLWHSYLDFEYAYGPLTTLGAFAILCLPLLPVSIWTVWTTFNSFSELFTRTEVKST